MKCPNCGTELPNNALFCSECGMRLDDSSSNIPLRPHVPGERPSPMQGAPYGAAQGTPHGPAAFGGGAETPPESASAMPRQQRNYHVGIIVAVVFVLFLVIGGIASCVALARIGGHTGSTHPVTFRIAVFANYETDSSRIPVRITGTDADGNDVDQTIFLAYSGVDVELPNGDYHAEVLGSPITSEGIIFEVPTEGVDFSLGSSLRANEPYTVSSDNAFVFFPVDPEDMTDEQVEDALSWARKDEGSNADVSQLERALQERRDSAKTSDSVQTKV